MYNGVWWEVAASTAATEQRIANVTISIEFIDFDFFSIIIIIWMHLIDAHGRVGLEDRWKGLSIPSPDLSMAISLHEADWSVRWTPFYFS